MVDMHFKIESGKISDIDELEKLYNNLNDYLETTVNYPGWKKGIYPTRADAVSGIGNGLFVLRVGNTIAGSVILNHIPEAAYTKATWGIDAGEKEVMVIHTLVTHPEFMKQGVAQKLLELAREYSLSIGCRTIRLDVNIQNEPAIALYEKCGYTYVETVDLGLPYEDLKWFHLYEFIL